MKHISFSRKSTASWLRQVLRSAHQHPYTSPYTHPAADPSQMTGTAPGCQNSHFNLAKKRISWEGVPYQSKPASRSGDTSTLLMCPVIWKNKNPSVFRINSNTGVEKKFQTFIFITDITNRYRRIAKQYGIMQNQFMSSFFYHTDF